MDRSLWAVLAGTFTLRFSTGLTGAMLTFYLADLDKHHGILDQILGFGPGEVPSDFAFALIAASFYVSELVLSPIFGVLSDRLGHWKVMQWGPFFGIVAVVITWATTNVPLIVGTRLLEGSATAASIPSILGFIAVATAMDEGLRGRTVARFEAATLAGLLAGFAAAGPLFTIFRPRPSCSTGCSTSSRSRSTAGASIATSRHPWRRRMRRAEAASTSRATARSSAGATSGCSLRPGSRSTRSSGLFTTQTIFQLVKEPNPKFADQLLMGGFEPLQISLGLGVAGILFFAGLIYWGNRFKTLRRTTIILYGLGGGALLVVAAVAINHSGALPGFVILLLAVPAVFGLFVLAGATPAAIGLLADVTEAYPDDRGAIMGLYSVFLGLGQIGGALIAGAAATALGLDGIFVASLVLLLLAVVPLVFLRRHEHYLAGPETPAAID